MENPRISLLIYGTRRNGGAWEPLAVWNTPPTHVLTSATAVGVSRPDMQYVTVKATPEYTQFTLVYCPWAICQGETAKAGGAKIALFIPAGYRIGGGATPMDLLQAVNQTMIDNNLTYDAARGVYKFKADTEFDQQVYADAIARFSLVPSQGARNVMRTSPYDPVGMVIVSPDKAALFLDDVESYPEVADYREIVVATAGDTGASLKLEIPRKKRYNIFADGFNITPAIEGYDSNPDDVIAIDPLKLKGLSHVAYTAEPIRFTLRDALEGRVEGVTVDPSSERLIVELRIKPLQVKYMLQLEGTADTSIYPDVKVSFGGVAKEVSPVDHSFILEGDEILRGATGISVTVENDRYEQAGAIGVLGQTVKVPVRLKPVAAPPPAPAPAPAPVPAPQPEPVRPAPAPKKESRFSFTVMLEDASDIGNADKPYELILANAHHTIQEEVYFSLTGEDGAAYTSTSVTVPESWAGEYEIYLKTDRVATVDDCMVEIGPGIPGILIGARATEKLGFFQRTPMWILAIGAALILLIVAIACHLIASAPSAPREYVEDYASTASTEKISQFQDQLNNPAIQFSEIEEMNAWLTENSSDLDEEGRKLQEQVADYMELIEILKNPANISMTALGNALADTKVNPIHTSRVRQLLQDAPADKVETAFRKLRNREPITSFSSIPNFETLTASASEAPAVDVPTSAPITAKVTQPKKAKHVKVEKPKADRPAPTPKVNRPREMQER